MRCISAARGRGSLNGHCFALVGRGSLNGHCFALVKLCSKYCFAFQLSICFLALAGGIITMIMMFAQLILFEFDGFV